MSFSLNFQTIAIDVSDASNTNANATVSNHDGANTSSNISDIQPAVNDSAGPCIFKVHHLLRNVNNDAYEPAIISIGPYHYGKPRLGMMEPHKLRSQAALLKRKTEPLSTYLDAIKPDEEKARKSYAEPTDHIPSNEFVEMLVLDGIFIIELLLNFRIFKETQRNNGQNVIDDPIFNMPWILGLLQRDLLLFENQLPLFVLVKLFGLIADRDDQQHFNYHVLEFFNDRFPGYGKKRITGNAQVVEDTKHLLDLIHMNWGSQRESHANGTVNMDNLELIRRSTKLKEVGIKFNKIEDKVYFDIEFKNGVLHIPVLTLDDNTESLLRNLIAFEEYCRDGRFHFVRDYMTFFSCLIKTKEDVEKLTRHGILASFIADDEVTTRMFSTILNYTNGPSKNFVYRELFERMNKHCKRRRNRYMAILCLQYADSPWKILSISGASALLALAILQVIFQILSWKDHI